ncbi:MAG TPA: hypothetical protein VI685_22355 [Candidatus Angelobacter sp.]
MTNYSFAVWIILSIGLLLLFVYAAVINLRRQRSPKIDLGEVVPALLPVNLQAFAEAIDPTQDARLRQTGSRRESHKQLRQRARVAADWLRRMSHNAALLQRVGYGQLRSSNPLVAAQAQELIDAGVHVRFYAFLGLAALLVRRIAGVGTIPLAKVSDAQKMMSSSLIPAYESLRSKAQEMTALRDTAFRDALTQAL